MPSRGQAPDQGAGCQAADIGVVNPDKLADELPDVLIPAEAE